MEAVASAVSERVATQAVRILFVAPPARGGLAQHVISLIAGLYQEGWEIGVASAPEGPIARATVERSLPLYEINIASIGGPVKAGLSAMRLSRAISEFRPQIVHTHSFGAGLIGSLSLTPSTRLVATIHNYPPDSDGMVSKRRSQRWAIQLICRRASRLITVSEKLSADIQKAVPQISGKCITIPNGIDLHAPVKHDPTDVRKTFELLETGLLVGLVARLAPQKGILEFIRAGSKLAELWPEIVLVIAGDGPLMEQAKELRTELQLQGKLHLLSEVEHARDLINALDILVVASTSEGSSRVAMEAMALGKPVVATAVGGVPEVVLDEVTGLLVPPGDPEAIADAVDKFLRDPDLAQEMGERGRRHVIEHFDIKQMLEQTKAVYADLLREGLDAGGALR